MDYFLLHGDARGDRQGDTQSADVHRWLITAVRELGVLVAKATGRDAFVKQIGTVDLEVVLMRFASSPTLIDVPDQDQKLGEGADTINEAMRLVTQLARLFPSLPLMTVSSAADDRAMLAVLRVGVKDFVDMGGVPAKAMRVVRRLLVGHASAEPTHRDRVLAVLGTRPGVGATTLATNLAALVRRTSVSDVMLLDLGQPLRDGTLYLDMQANLHFVGAVCNLRHFDQVFMQTALSRHLNGLAILPLPISLAGMHGIPFSKVLGLLNRLRMFFDLQVVDLNGFGNIGFITQITETTDDVMLVTEQSVSAIVSAVELMQELKKREIDRGHLHLTISRFDARLSLDITQIAERLEVPSVLTVLSRREALVVASNQGATLAEARLTDTCVRTLARIAQTLGYTQQSTHASTLSSWVSGASARLGEHLGGRSRRRSTDATELDIGTAERNAT